MTCRKVVIYSTPTCPYCRRAKQYFKEKGVDFTDYNVAADRKLAEEMIHRSGQMGVPVIIIDDEVLIGFNQALLDKLLAK